jgi:alpha-glucosidase
MLNLYRRLIRLREAMPALVHGSYRSMDLGNIPVFGYFRESGTQRILVLLNFSKEEQKISYLGAPQAKVLCATSPDRQPGEKISLRSLRLKPSEGCVLGL